jgi:hypothetical protein
MKRALLITETIGVVSMAMASYIAGPGFEVSEEETPAASMRNTPLPDYALVVVPSNMESLQWLSERLSQKWPTWVF